MARHGQGDWSERTIAYFDIERRDRLVLFLNGLADITVEAPSDGMNALDPDSKSAKLYRGWVQACRRKSGS